MSTVRPLCEFKSGSRVTVSSLCACGAARCRLCALGLTPGTELTVESGGKGPCRVTVRGSSLVLGHGMACKVMVQPVDEADCKGSCSRGALGVLKAVESL